jgi:hypothetical protein
VILRVIVPAIALSALVGIAKPLLGVAGLGLPAVPLLAVLLCARNAPRPRYRLAAVGCGVAAGVPYAGLLLVPAMSLVALGALAHATRLLVPRDRWLAQIISATIFATADFAFVNVLAGASAISTLGLAGWTGAVSGLLLTGVVSCALDQLVARRPRLRHALERP